MLPKLLEKVTSVFQHSPSSRPRLKNNLRLLGALCSGMQTPLTVCSSSSSQTERTFNGCRPANNRYDKGIKSAMTASALKLFPDQAHNGDSSNSSVTSASATKQTSKPTPTASSEAAQSSQLQKAPHEILVKEPRRFSRFFRL